VTATIESTGFPDGLFDPRELESSTFKDDKSAKVEFLDKLIRLVNVGGGVVLEINSTKIVAGLEPYNTNILLTGFGRLAVDNDLDRNMLIQHCRNGLGIDEYKSIHVTSTDVVETKLEGTIPGDVDPAKPKSPDSSGPSLMEQIHLCSGDMDQTIQMISSIVSKPKCSEKLLSKPPFRFLHDLFVAIASATDFNLGQVFR
jgi:hypothetical protein